MLPKVLNEKQVHPFKFYLEGEVQQGMRHNGLLYALVGTFSLKERLKAYDVATQLAESDCRAVVTVSDQYCIWIPLTSSEYLRWQRSAATRAIAPQVSPKKPSLALPAPAKPIAAWAPLPFWNAMPLSNPC